MSGPRNVGRLMMVALAAALFVPAVQGVDAGPTTTLLPAAAPTTIDQAIVPLNASDPGGPLLFKLDYWINRPKDNLIAMVSGAARYSGVSQFPVDYWAKNFWLEGFDSTSDEIVWTVELEKPTTFNVRFNMNSGVGDEFLLDSPGTSASLRFARGATQGMEIIEAGTIVIPEGRHELRLRKSQTTGFSSSVKSIELIRSSDYAAYQQRVAKFQGDAQWVDGKRGYMVQWGAWSYPKSGPKGSNQDTWNQFNVNLFVNEMVKAKADYVVFSVSWIDYLFPGPNQAVDNIMGPGVDLTANRDLLMEVAKGLEAKGIELAIYYHVGHGDMSAAWWAKQNFPNATFPKNAYGDRSTFFKNWKAVIGEMGQRYGTLIKGFFFDDGLAYYPADFEDLSAVARTGNPHRFVSYNQWIAARYTDFQDVGFGEANCEVGKVGTNGRYLDGPNKGLLQQCMITAHNDWGVYTQDNTNPGIVRSTQWYQDRFASVHAKGAMTIAHMMFNGPTFVDKNPDGTIGDGNLNMGLAPPPPAPSTTTTTLPPTTTTVPPTTTTLPPTTTTLPPTTTTRPPTTTTVPPTTTIRPTTTTVAPTTTVRPPVTTTAPKTGGIYQPGATAGQSGSRGQAVIVRGS